MSCWWVRYEVRGVRFVRFLVVVAMLASLLGSNTAVAQTGTYEDVAGDVYYSQPVAELAAEGVFAGTVCADGFCPGEPIDRETMAVWTVRVLDGKDPAAKALGEKGGTARARNLSKEQRTEIARNAANVRWRKQKD